MSTTKQLQLIPDKPPGADFEVLATGLFLAYPFEGPEPTAAMVESVRRWGILQPVLVSKAPAGARHPYHIYAGQRRVRAAIQTEQPVPAYVIDHGDPNVLRLIENSQRRPNLAAEFHAISSLRQQGADESAICLATGMTPGQVRMRLKLASLDPRLLVALNDGLMKSSTARLAAKLPAALQGELIKTLSEQGRVKVADVKRLRTAQAQAAAAQLPHSLFHDPATVHGCPWYQEVEHRLGAARQSLRQAFHPDTPDRVLASVNSLALAIDEVLALALREKDGPR